MSRLQIKTSEGQPGGPFWLRIMHCDRSSDLMTSKQTKNWKPGGPLILFSTLIWKNTSIIWSISAQSCDVIDSPTYHHQLRHAHLFLKNSIYILTVTTRVFQVLLGIYNLKMIKIYTTWFSIHNFGYWEYFDKIIESTSSI